mgnify:CR=1 FL=1
MKWLTFEVITLAQINIDKYREYLHIPIQGDNDTFYMVTTAELF